MTPRPNSRTCLLRTLCACLLCVSGIALLFMGFWVVPAGTIDHSVLIAFGEAMTFAGALFGVIARPSREG